MSTIIITKKKKVVAGVTLEQLGVNHSPFCRKHEKTSGGSELKECEIEQGNCFEPLKETNGGVFECKVPFVSFNFCRKGNIQDVCFGVLKQLQGEAD